METRLHTELIGAWLSPAGKRILDVGCGSGALTRFLAREGAHATGIEISAEALVLARQEPPVADESYVEGAGEALPFPDASADAVLYLNALHHVPVAAIPKAVEEAARVVRPGGELLVIEPLAEGDYFSLVRRVEDETEVRAIAYRALQAAPREKLKPVREETYLTPFKFRDFDAFTARVIAADPARRPVVETYRETLRREFERLGRPDAEGIRFDLPHRANLFIRT